MKNLRLSVVFALFIPLLYPHSACAEIYKWVDEQGNSHFTDKPPANKKTVEIKLQINTYTAVQIKPLEQRLGRKDKVVIYSTAWCGICKQAKKYFRDNDIAFMAYDVEKSRIGKRDYKSLRGKAVPIIIVGNKRMNGFTPSKFEKVYKEQMQANKTDEET